MRRFLFCLLFAFSLFIVHTGCKKEKILEDPMKVELPPPTQQGLNTVGCRINGVPFVPSKGISFYAVNSPLVVEYNGGSKFFRIVAQRFSIQESNEWRRTIIYPSATFYKEGVYSMTSEISGLNDTSSVCGTLKLFSSSYYSKVSDIVKGTMTITRFEPELKIVSGTFEYDAYSKECRDTTRITEGRFDVKF
jgi:hypothetical protein